MDATTDRPARARTAAAFLLVLLTLTVPADLSSLTAGALLRIPVEALLGVAVLLLLPPRPRRVVAVGAGVVLGLLTVLKLFDIGFRAALARPFDPMLDWSLTGAAMSLVGPTWGLVAVVGAGLVVVAVVVAVTAAVVRVATVAARHRTVAARTVAALTVVWMGAAALGLPVATGNTAALAYAHTVAVRDELRDHAAFEAQLRTDAYRDVPGDRLLQALRGKDVALTFVESYGRVAVDDPQVGALLTDGSAQLAAAGFGVRSAYLTSPTFGGGSVLAHSTLQSGVWVDNQRSYDELLGGDRFTLERAFGKAGWQTAAVMPGLVAPWPEGQAFYGYDRVHPSYDIGYHGPTFSYATMPDQFTLAAFERLERQPGHAPVMAEIVLVSSHAPWDPLPSLVPWDQVGDGSVFTPMSPYHLGSEIILTRDPAQVHADFLASIRYSMSTLVSYVQHYAGDDLVLVVLGDHQPSPIVTGPDASHDVPISIIARDPKVLDRIASWGWEPGLRPSPQAPVWGMDGFRDRFLAAFSR